MQAWYASPFTTKWLLGPINDTRGWRLWERCMAQLMILRSSKKVFQVGPLKNVAFFFNLWKGVVFCFGGEGKASCLKNVICKFGLFMTYYLILVQSRYKDNFRSPCCNVVLYVFWKGNNEVHVWEYDLQGLFDVFSWCLLGRRCGKTGGVGFWKRKWAIQRNRPNISDMSCYVLQSCMIWI